MLEYLEGQHALLSLSSTLPTESWLPYTLSRFLASCLYLHPLVPVTQATVVGLGMGWLAFSHDQSLCSSISFPCPYIPSRFLVPQQITVSMLTASSHGRVDCFPSLTDLGHYMIRVTYIESLISLLAWSRTAAILSYFPSLLPQLCSLREFGDRTIYKGIDRRRTVSRRKFFLPWNPSLIPTDCVSSAKVETTGTRHMRPRFRTSYVCQDKWYLCVHETRGKH